MLNQIVNRLQGQVRIRVETAFPERVLNLCGTRNLAFWNMTPAQKSVSWLAPRPPMSRG